MTEASDQHLRVRRLAHLLDSSVRIPGTQHRFGLDAVVGLVPGIGDAAGLALSTAVIVQAVELGARGATVVRMVLNVLLDAAVGSVPVLGWVFDVVFKANQRNVSLLERHVQDPGATRVASAKAVRRTVLGVLVACLAVGTALLALTVWLVSLLF